MGAGKVIAIVVIVVIVIVAVALGIYYGTKSSSSSSSSGGSSGYTTSGGTTGGSGSSTTGGTTTPTVAALTATMTANTSTPLNSGYYVWTNSSNGKELPIIMNTATGSNGALTHGTALDLLRADFTLQTPSAAIWYITLNSDNSYTMTNYVNGSAQCISNTNGFLGPCGNSGTGTEVQIVEPTAGSGLYSVQMSGGGNANCIMFGNNGQATSTSLYTWNEPTATVCGFTNIADWASNGQSSFKFYRIDAQ